MRARRSCVRVSTRSTTPLDVGLGGMWPATASVLPSGEKSRFWMMPLGNRYGLPTGRRLAASTKVTVPEPPP